VPEPGYPVYERGALFAGARVVTVPLREEAGWLPDLDAFDAWDELAVFWICYPSNPTGATAALPFYEELARAYPGAKVLLSIREPDSWYESFHATIGRSWEDPARRPTRILKLIRAVVPGADRQISAIEAVLLRRTFGKTSLQEPLGRREAISAFVAHNEEVKRRVPEERLLVWEVKEGWGPLCAFLGVPEPEEPFPHVNEREGFESTVLANLAVGILRASAPAVLAGVGAVAAGALVLWSLRHRPRHS